VFHFVDQDSLVHDPSVPELRGFDFTPAQSGALYNLFQSHSTDGAMVVAQLRQCLIEQQGMRFVAENPYNPAADPHWKTDEAFEQMEQLFVSDQIVTLQNCRDQMLRWSSKQKLDLELAETDLFFDRFFSFFDTQHEMKIDLRTFAIGMSKICSAKPSVVMEFLFYMTDTKAEGILMLHSVEQFAKIVRQLRIQIHLNVLNASEILLLEQGYEPEQIVEASKQVCSQLGQNLPKYAQAQAEAMCALCASDSIDFGQFLHEGPGDTDKACADVAADYLDKLPEVYSILMGELRGWI